MAQIIEVEKIEGEDIAIVIKDKPIPPPEPIPDPFVLIDSAVKGVNGYQNNYQGGGWTDGVNVPGWYLGTLSYTATPNAYNAFKFNGTKIEWYTEKGPTHGIVGVSIDGLNEVMIDLYAAEFTPMVKVFESELLEQVLHTLKLRCTGTKNPLSSNVYLITDMVKVFNPQDVLDVPIPPTDEIVIQPGQPIKAIIESAAAGKTVRLLEGSYSENQFTVPANVTLKGAGKAKTTINFTGTMAQQSENGMIQLKSGSQLNGNQEISGFTIKGNNLCNGGIIVDKRDTVKILDVKVQDTTYFGAWLKNSTNSELANSEFYNSSWASVGWCTGEICVFNLKNMLIHHNVIKTDKTTKGYGIKALWPDGSFNGKIYSNIINMHPTSLWNNGQAPNISIELAACFYDGIEIFDNDIVNVMSMAAHRATKSGRLIISGNRMNMLPNTTCAVELVCSNVTLQNNLIRGCSIIAANFQPNGKWVDQIIDNNDFVSNNANPGWGGTFLIGPDGANMTYKNNKITKGNYTLVKHMGSTANSTIVDGGGNIIN